MENQKLSGELKKIEVLEDELNQLDGILKKRDEEIQDLRKLNAELEFNIQELKQEL